MKNIFSILLPLVTVLAFAINALPQSGKPNKANVDVLIGISRSLLKQIAHREKMTNVTVDPQRNVNQTYGFMKEYLPSGDWHCVSESKSSVGAHFSESIFAGGIGFSKIGKQPWKQDSDANCDSGLDSLEDWPGEATGGSVRTQEIVRRENVSLGKLVADVIEVTTRDRFGKENNENIYVSRYWFDKDGKIVKAERESTSTKSKSRIKRTSIYEYDPSIKIKAPIK